MWKFNVILKFLSTHSTLPRLNLVIQRWNYPQNERCYVPKVKLFLHSLSKQFFDFSLSDDTRKIVSAVVDYLQSRWVASESHRNLPMNPSWINSLIKLEKPNKIRFHWSSRLFHNKFSFSTVEFDFRLITTTFENWTENHILLQISVYHKINQWLSLKSSGKFI